MFFVCGLVFLFAFDVSSVFVAFLYVPFILLRFLVSFLCFLRFSIFRAAALQISRVSSILRLLLSILLSCLAILRFCCLFLPIGYMLVSFRYISCRFYTDLMCSFDFTAFWFHFASLLPGSGWQTMRKTWLTDFRVLFVAQLLPQWFTMFTSFLDVHFISQDWSAIISIVPFFTQQIWHQNYRPATTTTKTKQKQHHVRNPVAKESNITNAITKNNITNIITNNIAKYSKQ